MISSAYLIHIDEKQEDLQALRTENARMKRESESIKDARAGLERELEISKRSNKALNEEMYSVLKMRDEAAKEREEMARVRYYSSSSLRREPRRPLTPPPPDKMKWRFKTPSRTSRNSRID